MDINSLPHFLGHSLSVVNYLKYFFVFLGAVIEGPIVMVASGFLLNFNFFEIVPLFTALLLGDLVGDIIWYYIGHHFAHRFIKRFGKFFGLTEEIFEKVKLVFYKYHDRILFFSKMVMGFGMAIYILMVAGATKVKFSKYIILNTIGGLFFVTILLSIGYYFGNFYKYFLKGFRVGFIILLLFIVAAIVYNIQKYIKDKALKSL